MGDPEVRMAAVAQFIEIDRLVESKTNPRRTVNGPALDELTESVREHGVLQPILVRPIDVKFPKPPGTFEAFELVAGHRRLAAARKAGLQMLPAMVRELDDQAVLEIQLIENLQRSDLHALEEAEGYRQLMATKKYDVARIAERIGRSAKYVYDRVKLLSLIKDAQKLFLEDRITAGHAIILARLKPADQKRAIEVENTNHYGDGNAPLFQHENSLFPPDEHEVQLEKAEKDPYIGLKARSVRELQAWVDKHVRFDAGAADVPDLFPETHVTVKQAKELAEKIIPITHEYHVPPEARDENRVYGPMSWHRADGAEESKTCDHSVTGVIVIGAGRGEAFKVCVAKEKCKVHWGEWQRARAKRQKGAAVKGSTGEARHAAEERDYKLEREKQEIERKRHEKAIPAILKAVAMEIPEIGLGRISDLVVSAFNRHGGKLSEAVPRGKTAEDLVRHLAYNAISSEANAWDWERFAKRARAIGVDVAGILNLVAPVQTSAKPDASAKKPAKQGKIARAIAAANAGSKPFPTATAKRKKAKKK